MDGKGIHYIGESVAIDPKGQVITLCKPASDCVTHATFDAAGLADFRAKFPVGMEKDDFDLRV